MQGWGHCTQKVTANEHYAQYIHEPALKEPQKAEAP